MANQVCLANIGNIISLYIKGYKSIAPVSPGETGADLIAPVSPGAIKSGGSSCVGKVLALLHSPFCSHAGGAGFCYWQCLGLLLGSVAPSRVVSVPTLAGCPGLLNEAA